MYRIIVFAALLSACQSPSGQEKNTDSLQNSAAQKEMTMPMLNITVQEDDFSITFPYPPEKNVDSTDASVFYVAANETGEEKYALLYRDFSERDFGGDSEEVFLTKAKKGILSGFLEQEIQENKDIEVGKYEGFTLKVGSPTKDFFRYKVLLIERRLYQIIIINTRKIPESEIGENFINSFELKINTSEKEKKAS